MAGAINADNIISSLSNIKDGIKTGVKLIKLGYAPFVPHLDFMFGICGQQTLTIDEYRNYSIEWLKASEVLLIINGERTSAGVIAEIIEAEEMKIPIIYGWSDFFEWHMKQCVLDTKGGIT